MNICSDKLTNVCGIVNGTEIIIIIIIIAISDHEIFAWDQLNHEYKNLFE